MQPSPSHARIVDVEEGQVPVAADVLARAFFDDAFVGVVLPDPSLRRKALPTLMSTYAWLTLMNGELHATAGEVQGCAGWLAPGQTDVTLESMTLAGLDEFAEVAGDEAVERFLLATMHLKEVHQRLLPTEHWYLLVIGVLTEVRNQGIGTALLQPVLEHADETGVPCYLETMAPRSLPLYRRLGFEVRGQGELPGFGAPFWALTRPPRRGALAR